MEEDAPRTERSSISGSTHTIPQPQQDVAEVFTPSFSPSSAPSSPTPTGTLSRLGLKGLGSPTAAGVPGSPGGQVSAITVVALLDKLVNMLEAVQDNQQRMEQRQADLESAVRVVQGDVTRLSKTHVCTSNSVSKLLERSRKVSCNLKEVKERMDKQAVQVKKLEANHSHLLKRNHFKVLIFQEDNEIPTSVSVKDSLKTPLPSQYDAESIQPPPSTACSIDGSRTQDEGLQTISLSSDDDGSVAVNREEYEVDCDSVAGPSRPYERRADKFKRSSLKKVDSIKKAFSRQSIEKKVNQITTKIVPPEKREKLKKSLTPSHPKSPTTKSSSFKVSPLTFNVKKVRDGDVTPEEMISPGEGAHVEIPPLGSIDGEHPLAEVHNEDVLEEGPELLSPSTPDAVKAELTINGKAPNIDCNMDGERLADLAVPEQDEDVGVDDEEEDQEAQLKIPADKAAEVQITSTGISVQQVS